MKKIIFNDRYGLTQAVLDGRKTMTRRIIKPKYGCSIESVTSNGRKIYYFKNKSVNVHGCINGVSVSNFDGFVLEKARYQVGEVVAIAQSYKDCGNTILKKWGHSTDIALLGLKKLAGWNNKMFVKAKLMPHHIRITNIRVERLQDITDEDCLREGIFNTRPTSAMFGWNFDTYFNTPREAFSVLIDKVSGKGTWALNPYVFVYEFELVD